MDSITVGSFSDHRAPCTPASDVSPSLRPDPEAVAPMLRWYAGSTIIIAWSIDSTEDDKVLEGGRQRDQARRHMNAYCSRCRWAWSINIMAWSINSTEGGKVLEGERQREHKQRGWHMAADAGRLGLSS